MSDTGARYNNGKLRWRNVPMFMFEDIIKVGQFGEAKYTTFNFLKGLPMSDTLDSLKRHLNSFESPYESDFDEESKINHLSHVAWNAIVALHMYKHRPDLDDRYKLPESNVIKDTPKSLSANEIEKKANDCVALTQALNKALENPPISNSAPTIETYAGLWKALTTDVEIDYKPTHLTELREKVLKNAVSNKKISKKTSKSGKVRKTRI